MSEPSTTDTERAALAALLDTLVPASRDGRLPGAGGLGIAAALEREVPELLPLLRGAIAALDEIAGAGGFAALDADARDEALRVYDEREPGFLPGLLFQTYTRYYTTPRVVEALGMEARAPWPKGYDLEQPDLDALLAPVRAGPRRYREA